MENEKTVCPACGHEMEGTPTECSKCGAPVTKEENPGTGSEGTEATEGTEKTGDTQ